MRKLFILNCIIILLVSILFVSCMYYNEKLLGGDKISYEIQPPGAGSVNENTQDNGLVLVTAEPSEGYIFDEWSGGLQGPINNYPIEYVESDTITAHFIEETGTSPPLPDIVIPDVENEGILEIDVPSNMPSDFDIIIENIGDGKLFLDDVMVTNNDVFSVIQQPTNYELQQDESTNIIISANVDTGETKETLVVIPNNDPDESPYTFDLKFTGVEKDVKWLFMMYMVGDNNLASPLWSDINEMEHGLSLMDQAVLDEVKVLVLWDGNSYYDTTHPAGGKLYELGPDSNLDDLLGANTIDHTADKWWSGDEVDMGDGNTLKEFINWARSKYPAYQYNIINMSGNSSSIRGEDPPSREGWSDEESGDTSLYTNEIQQAFINAGCINNQLSLISMDTCIMGNVEMAYEYRGLADYFVATPENMNVDGFEYQEWLPDINTNSTPKDLAQILVESLRDDVSGQQALTAVNLMELENLKTKIDELVQAIVEEDNQTSIMSVINTTYSNNVPSWYLGNLFENLTTAPLSSTLTDAAVDAHTALSHAIVYSWRGNYNDGYTYDGTGNTTYEGLVIQSSNETWYTSDTYNDSGGIDFCNTTDDGTINTWKELLEEWY